MKGDTWELSLTATSIAAGSSSQLSVPASSSFGFSGKGGFLKFDVPANQAVRITVQDIVKKKGKTRFEYRGRGRAGLISFTDICLRKVAAGSGLAPSPAGPPPETTTTEAVAQGSQRLYTLSWKVPLLFHVSLWGLFWFIFVFFVSYISLYWFILVYIGLLVCIGLYWFILVYIGA